LVQFLITDLKQNKRKVSRFRVTWNVSW